jgi:2-keto-4-pentenoate hydratase/2-oxohepta-3-ene-1,7-dioic acid hydratase in catechol pathway
MKLLRYGPAGQEKPGILDADGRIRDLSAHVADIDGAALTPEGLAKIAKVDVASLPLVAGEPRIGACVGKVGKFLCIGLNYADHAAEAGMKLPPEPVLFMKANSCIVGPNDDVVLPRTAAKGDWEVELGVVIGRRAKYVTEAEALDHVAGYCTINDVSERSFQAERAGQWTKGKSCDTFGPIGPWVVTRDEVPDPQDLKLWCHVNGEVMQNGSTKTMVFGVAHIVSYLSQFFTLEPGDVIATGTPPGVGMGHKPPLYLKAGDVMVLGGRGLGEQRQVVVDSPAA